MEWLTKKEAAEHLKICVRTLERNILNEPDFEGTKHIGKSVRISKEYLDSWVMNNSN